MENTQFRHVRSTSFEMTATEETLSQRDFRVGRRLLSNEAAMNALEQVECCKHIQFSDVTGGDYYHNSRIQLSPYRYNHQYQQQRHCILNSRNLYYRFYIAFIYLLILFSVQCIHSKPTSLSMKRDLNVTSSSLMYTSAVIPSLSSIINSSYSSSSLSSVSPIIWSSPSTVAIASNILPSVKNKSLSTDDLLFEYLDILTNPNFNASHANDIRITNVFMRSQRTKRSLSFYMSNLDTSPLFLVSSIKNDVTEQKYLSIHDNGTVRLVNSHRHISAMITVSVIVEWSTLMNKDQLLKSLRPRDGSRLIIRKFAKNVCICMYPNGTVFTERIINQTITDSCEWRLRVSRHGIGFERELSEDDINNGSAEFYASNSPSKTIPNNRSPTLSVTDEQSNTLASGWTHWLWQPEATWQVYGVKPSALKAFTEAQNDTTNYQRFISIYIENLNQKGVTAEYKNSYQSNTQNLTSTTFASSSPTLSPSSNPTVKVGSQQVIVLEAPAYYFNTLHHKAKYKHCRTLKSKLAQLVQTELLVSFRILDRYREAFKKLLYIVQKYSATNNNTDNHQYIDNNNKPTPYKIAELLDQWLMLLDYKWRQTTRQSYKMNSTFNNCSLSFKSSFEINTVGNDSSDRILVKLYETRLKTKIYYGLFENLQHIVEWTNDEKHYWLQHPRIIKLFHYLHIKCPSSQKLRQASFILRQYLPKYSPKIFTPGTL
ncbi:unnamed protein product [Heterobilharzia americana]|nr:unnamed protein product [Heterobilharzia americana]